MVDVREAVFSWLRRRRAPVILEDPGMTACLECGVVLPTTAAAVTEGLCVPCARGGRYVAEDLDLVRASSARVLDRFREARNQRFTARYLASQHEDPLPRRRGHHALASFEQRYTELFFQFLDRDAEGRLAHVTALRSTPKMLLFGKRDDVTQLGEGHATGI